MGLVKHLAPQAIDNPSVVIDIGKIPQLLNVSSVCFSQDCVWIRSNLGFVQKCVAVAWLK